MASTNIGVDEFAELAASNSSSVISEGKDCAEPSSNVSRKDLDLEAMLFCLKGTAERPESELRLRASVSADEGEGPWAGKEGESSALSAACGGGRWSTSIPMNGGRLVLSVGEGSRVRVSGMEGEKEGREGGEKTGRKIKSNS